MIKIFRNKNDQQKVNVEFQSQDSFFVIKNILSSFIGSYFNRSDKTWRVDIDDTDAMIKQLLEIKGEILQVDLNIYDAIDIFREKRDDLLQLRNSLDGHDCGIALKEPHQLLPFQHVGVEFMYQVRKGIVADKVGLGKTIQGFCGALKLIREGVAKKCLIIVPGTLRKKWKRDIEKFLDVPEPIILEGVPSKRQSMYEKWMDNEDPFAIISDDTLKRDWPNYMENNVVHPYGVVIDEIQREKNPQSNRSQMIREVAEHKLCKFKFGLSATYVETGLENLFGVMLIVDNTVFGNSPSKFDYKYLVTNDYTGKVTGYKNVDDATRRMKYVAIRRHKEQVKDQMKTFLPKVNVNTLWVELNKDQKQVYNEVVSRVADNIRNMEKADKIRMATVLTELNYLRQVSISTELIGHEISSSVKMDILKEMLPEIIEENKVMIFCHYTGFVDQMERELNLMGIKNIAMHGSRVEGSAKNRQDMIDKFSESKDINVLITSDILKEGVDVPAASYIINTDILWNPAGMVQRAGRIDRLNQTNENIFVINIWSESGIEKDMHDVVYKREELANQVMDDGFKEKRVRKLSFKDVKRMLRRV